MGMIPMGRLSGAIRRPAAPPDRETLQQNKPEAARLDSKQKAGRGLLHPVCHIRAWRQGVEGVATLRRVEEGGVVLEPAAGGLALWKTISRQCG